MGVCDVQMFNKEGCLKICPTVPALHVALDDESAVSFPLQARTSASKNQGAARLFTSGSTLVAALAAAAMPITIVFA